MSDEKQSSPELGDGSKHPLLGRPQAAHTGAVSYQVSPLPTPDERAGIPESGHVLPYFGDADKYEKDSPPASSVADKGGSNMLNTQHSCLMMMRQLSTRETDGQAPAKHYELMLKMQRDRMQRVDAEVLELAIKHTLHGSAALKGHCPDCGISESQLREVKAYWDEFFKKDESDCHAGTAILQVAALHMRNCKAESCLIAKYLPQLMPDDVEDDVFKQQFLEHTRIGIGGFGAVYKVKHRLDKQYYAVKATRLDTSSQDSIEREVYILAKLSHKGVVRYHYGWVQDLSDEEIANLQIPSSSSTSIRSAEESHSGRSVSNIVQFVRGSGTSAEGVENQRMHKVLFIQMELCSTRSLRTWLDETAAAKNRSRRDIFQYFEQILEALCYIHDKDVIHRDLKPSNAFFTNDGTLKIGDFGLSRDTSGSSEDDRSPLSKEVGTRMYWSPEMEEGDYTCKTDVYALGLVLYEMHHPVCSNMEKVEALEAAKASNPPDEIKRSFPIETEVVRRLLCTKAEDRPSAKEIQASSFLEEWSSAIDELDDDSIPKEIYNISMKRTV